MQKINEEKRQQKNKHSNILVWVFVTVVVFLSISRVIIANQTVGASEKLRNLDNRIAAFKSQNEVMAEDLRQKESLASLQNQAGALGFSRTDKYSFLSPSAPVAFNGNLSNL